MLTAYDITGPDFWFQRGDVDALHYLMALLPEAPVCVNIGAGFGTSALTMAEARPDAFVFSIDIEARPDEEKYLRAAGLWEQHRVVRILGGSQIVGLHWPHKVDLVFVDGGHLFQDVHADALIWTPNVKPDGIIAFHDYGRESLPSVKQAVDAVMFELEVLLHRDTLIAYRVPG